MLTKIAVMFKNIEMKYVAKYVQTYVQYIEKN